MAIMVLVRLIPVFLFPDFVIFQNDSRIYQNSVQVNKE